MKIKSLLFCTLLLISCKNESPVVPEPDSKPEFVLNRINCSFKIFMTRDTVTNDTIVKTTMRYGLDAYFHLNYGSIEKQIVSFNGFTDTIQGSAVAATPDIKNLPVWYNQYEVPNILGQQESVKVTVEFFGSFYGEATLQNPVGNFYLKDSNYAFISRSYFFNLIPTISDCVKTKLHKEIK